MSIALRLGVALVVVVVAIPILWVLEAAGENTVAQRVRWRLDNEFESLLTVRG